MFKASATLFLTVLLVGGRAWAGPSAGQISYAAGTVERLVDVDKHTQDGQIAPNAPWKALKKGQTVAVGEAIRTGAKSRVEISLPDGSRLRLGSSSVVALTQAHFDKKGQRKFSLGVWVGRVWAKVAKSVASDNAFEVQTRNAVAGVRGTSFTVVAREDLSAVVKVYAGTVGVRKSGAGAAGWYKTRSRVQVAGPTEIDKKQWEEIVATQMKQITVSSLGEIAPAEDFEDAGDEREWAMWNKARDEKVQ